MARPLGKGVTYFSFDVGFFGDEKIRLIKGEFGLQGVSVVIALLCEIYGDNGYYKKFGDVQRILLAEKLGSSIKPAFIGEVLHGCFRCGFFDKTVFEVSGVLTSAGIQRRFLRAASSREVITIIDEYWLLSINDVDDVPASIRRLVVFKKITMLGNDNKLRGNAVKRQINKQRKESKIKKEKKLTGALALANNAFDVYAQNNSELQRALRDFEAFRAELNKPLTETAKERLCTKLDNMAIAANVRDADDYKIAALCESIERNWAGVYAPKEYVEPELPPEAHYAQQPVDARQVADGDNLAEMF